MASSMPKGNTAPKKFSPIPKSLGRDPSKGSINPGSFSPPAHSTKNLK